MPNAELFNKYLLYFLLLLVIYVYFFLYFIFIFLYYYKKNNSKITSHCLTFILRLIFSFKDTCGNKIFFLNAPTPAKPDILLIKMKSNYRATDNIDL